MSRVKADLKLMTSFCFVPKDWGIFANITYGISSDILSKAIPEEFRVRGKVQCRILSLVSLPEPPLCTLREVHWQGKAESEGRFWMVKGSEECECVCVCVCECEWMCVSECVCVCLFCMCPDLSQSRKFTGRFCPKSLNCRPF